MFLLCSSKLKRDVSGRKNLGWNTQATSFISEHGSEGCECDTLTSLISFDIFNNLAWMFSAAPAPAHSLCFDYSPDPGSLVSLVKWLSFQPSKLTLWESKIFRTFPYNSSSSLSWKRVRPFLSHSSPGWLFPLLWDAKNFPHLILYRMSVSPAEIWPQDSSLVCLLPCCFFELALTNRRILLRWSQPSGDVSAIVGTQWFLKVFLENRS